MHFRRSSSSPWRCHVEWTSTFDPGSYLAQARPAVLGAVTSIDPQRSSSVGRSLLISVHPGLIRREAPCSLFQSARLGKLCGFEASVEVFQKRVARTPLNYCRCSCCHVGFFFICHPRLRLRCRCMLRSHCFHRRFHRRRRFHRCGFITCHSLLSQCRLLPHQRVRRQQLLLLEPQCGSSLCYSWCPALLWQRVLPSTGDRPIRIVAAHRRPEP